MDKSDAIKKTKLPDVANIIVVASGKGGVGKSTIAAGLALSLAMEGYETGLLDTDIYGPSIPTLFALEDGLPDGAEVDGKKMILPKNRFGIKIMSIGFFIDPRQAMLWRGPMASKGVTQLISETNWGKLDYLIIDTPPGTGDIHLTLLQKFEISGALIVTTPQAIAIDDVQKAIVMYRNEHVGVPVLGIVENMSWFTPSKHPEERYFLFGQGGGQKLSKAFGLPLLARIPIDETICGSCDEGKLNGLFRNEEVRNGFGELVDGILEKTQNGDRSRDS